ncbi:hypothetical protein GCM10010992_27860 [Cloacibacterium rupense]|uniref:HTH araC/xylS-type domain-containing protein n=1 Tax=Cloacibacterium rupense TaxID=517423 RepID=A0ABQ2NNS2_9FLAO|nr:helix-turn-helix domain-containing protein [Cloacibacterium rupense]GGP06764.1 hypothetical protein GCM10010992_27860 [Cloacibacterium rupense]
MSLDEIDNSFENIHENITGEKVGEIYIRRAKKEKNIEALFRAYKLISFYTTNPKNLRYVDSAIITAKRINKPIYLANAYLARSTIKDINSSGTDGIKDLFIAHNYSKKTDDEYLKNRILYNLSLYYIYLGNYIEAKSYLISANNYFRKEFNRKETGKDNVLMYFYTIISLINCNNKLGKISESLPLYKEAYQKINLDKKHEVYRAYFLSSEGADAYYNKNYLLAINKLNEAIKQYNDNFTHYTEIYYLGLSYWKLNQKDQGVDYFHKLDKEYYKDKNQDPQFRPAYEHLIQYYKEKGNTDKQLEYINKLLFLDHSYEKNYKYLFNKINKEYTSELLIQEKNEIENSLKFHQLLIIFIIILSFSVGSFIFYRYSKVKKAYKQRFREILAEKNKFSINEQNSDSSKKTVDRLENHKTLLISKIPGLSPATIDYVLNKLDTFENENQFLNPKITLKSLCEEFNTNSGYLSRIINVYKQKNFTQYINDLRLDYIIEKMKTNKKYLSIEIKELASEAGFGNAESFSDNFQRKFKMKPSIFIKMMKENLDSNP